MSQFEWRGDQVESQVLAYVDRSLIALGGFLVDHMQGYAPVDTGYLRTGIHDTFDPASHTLTVWIPAPYGVYQEFGTRNIPPHPFIRPSIVDAAPGWAWMGIEWTLIINPPAQRSEPLIATTSGFRVPKRQKLTAQQLGHVNTVLRPTSKGLAKSIRRGWGKGKFSVRGRRQF